jgi:hypothetical protein
VVRGSVQLFDTDQVCGFKSFFKDASSIDVEEKRLSECGGELEYRKDATLYRMSRYPELLEGY